MPNIQFPYPRGSSSSSSSSSSTHSAYASVRSSSYRQKRALKTYGTPFVGIVFLLCFLVWLSSSSSRAPEAPSGTPEVVIVTTLDPNLSRKHQESIKENRLHYASLHNYATLFPYTTDYDLMAKTPASWSTVPALRHAMTLFPHTTWIWYLSATALIMDPSEPLSTKVLEPRKLESLMIRDHPVVPPDSVIKTFSHLSGEKVDFIVSQDSVGLAGGSLLLRSGEWAKFFLDAWYDPLYRTYNFQKAEGHALEHMVQWHGAVLAKLALIPQKVLNSYVKGKISHSSGDIYEEGDFVANFHGCHRDFTRNCEDEMSSLLSQLKDEKRKVED